MRILIFSTYFLPIIGGVQTYVRLIAKGFSESQPEGNRVDVTLVTETIGAKCNDVEFPYRVIRRPGFLPLARMIRNSDVVFIAGPSLLPMMLSWLARKPFVIEQHGYQAVCPNGLLFLRPANSACPGYFLKRRYDRCAKCRAADAGIIGAVRSLLLTFPRRWLCNHAAANIAVTDHVRRRIELKHSLTILHGIELPSTDSQDGSAKADVSRCLRVAYVGRLVAEKGLPVLLRAARSLKNRGVEFELSLFGDGPDRRHLHAMVAHLDIEDRVRFVGELSRTDLDHAMREIHVLIMPSTWEETAGLAAIEHMMRGGVVIAADIGGLSEIVGEVALKFPPHDSEALAVCIRSLVENPAQIETLGAAACRRARANFSVDRMVQEHLQVFEKVTKLAEARR